MGRMPAGMIWKSPEYMRWIRKDQWKFHKKFGWRAAICSTDTMGNPVKTLYETSSRESGQYALGRSRGSAARRAINLFLEELKKAMKLGNLSQTRFQINKPDRLMILHLWLIDARVPLYPKGKAEHVKTSQEVSAPTGA